MVIIWIILGAVLIAADQYIKHWAATSLLPVETMDFIGFGDFRILDLRYVENTGAAFSSFSGQRWFLVALVSVMLAVLVIFTVTYKHKNVFFLISMTMILSGGVGNLIDRVRFGYVVDYLEVKLFSFAIFNFADVCVVLGAVFALIFLFFIEPKLYSRQEAFSREFRWKRDRSDD